MFLASKYTYLTQKASILSTQREQMS